MRRDESHEDRMRRNGLELLGPPDAVEAVKVGRLTEWLVAHPDVQMEFDLKEKGPTKPDPRSDGQMIRDWLHVDTGASRRTVEEALNRLLACLDEADALAMVARDVLVNDPVVVNILRDIRPSERAHYDAILANRALLRRCVDRFDFLRAHDS